MNISRILRLAAVPILALGAATPALSVRLAKVADGFGTALYVTSPPDDSRLFVVEREGRIKVVSNGNVLPTPFLDVSSRIVSGGEQGLLGLAFHPNYASNGRFYVNYTNRRGDTVVAEYQRSAGDPNQANPGSFRRLLRIAQPAGNHNGGMVTFGPDGYLYIGMGDGGGSGDTYRTSQRPSSLLAKMLRIDVNGSTARKPYRIPVDNPFRTRRGFQPEIYSLGLRNPWRFSFDRTRGDLWIGDVGQNRFEEISYAPAGRARGANFGWNRFEGRSRFSSTGLAGGRLIGPIAQYGHTGNPCDSVTGGYAYRGGGVPSLAGRYVYGDYCRGQVWTLRSGPNAGGSPVEITGQLGVDLTSRIYSFGEDAQGELYIAGGDVIYRFVE